MSPFGKYLSVLLICVALGVVNSHNIYQLVVGHTDREAPRKYDGIVRDNEILNEGFLRPDDVLYFDYFDESQARPGDVTSRDITFVHLSGNFTFVTVYEIGESQNASASITEGGIAYKYMTINMQSAPGNAYKLGIGIYGSEILRQNLGFKEISQDDFLKIKNDEMA